MGKKSETKQRVYALTGGYYMWHVTDRRGKEWSVIGDYLGREHDMVARAGEKQLVEEFYARCK